MASWKILFHHRTQGRGVEAVHILSVVDSLRSRGHEVTIISPPGADPQTEVHAAGPSTGPESGRRLSWAWVSRAVPQFVFELMEIAYNLAAAFRLRGAIRSLGKIDVYYERYALFLSFGTRLMRRRKIPIVLEVNDSVLVQRVRPLFFRRLAGWIEKKTFGRANALIVITGAFKQVLVQAGVPPGKIHVIHNTARDDKFGGHDSGAAVRARLGLQDATVVGFLGKAVPWHGVDVLLEACESLTAQHPSLHVLVVGDTSGHPELEEIASRAGLRDRVHFAGQVAHSEAASHIAAMDIAVMPNSNSFGSPVKLFEYMAMGKAIIAPRLAPIEELFEHGQTALLVEPGSTESMRAAIARLLDDPIERRALGEAGRSHFNAEFSWDRNADRTIAILDLVQRAQPG